MSKNGSLDIAIIGIGARAPNARSAGELWRNLVEGRECISFLGRHELEAPQAHLVGHPRFVMAAGLLRDIDQFDADLFGFSPRDAELTDPQHRLFLECAWEAFEDAGYDPTRAPRRVTVYGGQGASEYLPGGPWDATLASGIPECERVYLPFSNHVTARVSHVLGLTGESVEVRAACATGLVALLMGCRSLIMGDADLSLVGSSHVFIPERRGYLASENAFRFSPDGHCRTFDRRAHGLVHTSAVGALLLKRLEDALRDCDPIYAVVRGAAVNNDGHARPAYITPGIELQAECVLEAQMLADVAPETITYVEAHGIAVPMADAIEIAAMRRAFAAQTKRRGFCALGSIKPNIGHSVVSSGVMGLIKTAFALRHGTLPPQINFDVAHPDLNLDDSPFIIQREASLWVPACGVRRAGVHSFGMGGTNAHAVLESVAHSVTSDDPAGPRLFVLSARTPAALVVMRQRLAAHLREHPEQRLGDVAFTLAVGRAAQPYRWAAIAASREELVDALQHGAGALTGKARVDAPGNVGPLEPRLRPGPGGALRLRDAGARRDRGAMAELTGRWLRGQTVDWPHLFDGEMRRRVSLPTYPFQRQRYWLDDLHKTVGQSCA